MKLIVGIGSKKKVDNFCHILSSLKHMTDHIILHFDESGLYSQGLGSDHISLYEFKINNDWFDFYEFNESDAKIICLNAGIIWPTATTITKELHVFLVLTPLSQVWKI